MTTAKLVTSPGEGHGLTTKVTDPLYHALANGKPTKPILAIVELKPVGLGQRETAKGRHQHVVFEATHLEPVHDPNTANELRWLLQQMYEARTSNGDQRTFNLGLGGTEETRLDLLERIEEWAGKEGLTGGDLEAKWRDKFGIAPGSEWSYGDQGVPGDYRKASVAYLLEFGYDSGALDMKAPLPHEDREAGDVGDPDDEAGAEGDEPASDSGTSDEDAEAEASVGVKCQICNKKSKALTDGLCPKCAKNAGIPVAAEHQPEAATA